MSDRLAGTALVRGRVIPGASVRDAGSDRELRILELRGRKALVLCLVHDDCETCDRFMSDLSSSARDIATADGRVIRVAPEDPASERFMGAGGAFPAVVITDRYAAAWESYPATGHAFPPVGEVVATLWHLATMCPECGVPTWE